MTLHSAHASRSRAIASNRYSCPFQSRRVATMPSVGRCGSASRMRASRAFPGTKRARSIPVGTDVMCSSGMRMSRASWPRSASPVVTTCAVARVYNHRVLGLLPTIVETCRVRTRGGASPIVAHAIAVSQLSVELWVLIMSMRVRRLASQRRSARRSGSRFRRMPSGTRGIPMRSAAPAIGASGGVISVTWCPRSSMPRASVRMRISCPPHPVEFSV
jgi:hypothetical protein